MNKKKLKAYILTLTEKILLLEDRVKAIEDRGQVPGAPVPVPFPNFGTGSPYLPPYQVTCTADTLQKATATGGSNQEGISKFMEDCRNGRPVTNQCFLQIEQEAMKNADKTFMTWLEQQDKEAKNLEEHLVEGALEGDGAVSAPVLTQEQAKYAEIVDNGNGGYEIKGKDLTGFTVSEPDVRWLEKGSIVSETALQNLKKFEAKIK